MSAKMLALKGNRTTTGGQIMEGDETCLDNGQPIARHLDRASCGRCPRTGYIIGSAYSFSGAGKHNVVDGDQVVCDCPPGTNRVIAKSTMLYSA
jgi:ribosomal protein S27AE